MKYILDFDRTLFDTDAFVEQVASDNKTDILLTPAVWSSYSARDFLFDDVLAWIQSKPKESLIILTAMSPTAGPLASEFQREKLKSSGLAEFVSDIIFMVGDKGQYVQDFANTEPTCFVDDLLAHHLSVQSLDHSVISCVMDRFVQIPAQKTTNSNIHLVRNLADVDAIIESL